MENLCLQDCSAQRKQLGLARGHWRQRSHGAFQDLAVVLVVARLEVLPQGDFIKGCNNAPIRKRCGRLEQTGSAVTRSKSRDGPDSYIKIKAQTGLTKDEWVLADGDEALLPY